MAGARDWIICQLGAREHYFLPRALNQAGRLAALFTDIWAPPGGIAAALPGKLGQRLRERYAEGLEASRVRHFTASALGFEFTMRIRGRAADHWAHVVARNDWFQAKVARALQSSKLLDNSDRPVVFSYSYTARDVFRCAKNAGCRTVLGQIDPGPTEEDIVAEAVERHAALKPVWARAPEIYWRRWREECELADRIIVNSDWARTGLINAGITADKLVVIPLAYETAAAVIARNYPLEFSADRPLRVLFLGSLIVRKGIAELLEATRLLNDEPVEFHLVGERGVELSAKDVSNPKLILHGPATRGEVDRFYAAADLFILPSLSDGFGLTMLEARAHGLPVIASRRCGDVVQDKVNGALIDDVTGQSIAEAISKYIRRPDTLAQHSAACKTIHAAAAHDGTLGHISDSRAVVAEALAKLVA
jgi:glycosyltransferase involved in cell wall biosynthesis